MKYVIKKLSANFIFDELEQARKQFVDAISYTLDNAHIVFDKTAEDPLDINIEYDFQEKHGESVIYGFNLREEIAKNFALDVDKQHSSKQLLTISKSLRELADEIDKHYDSDPKKTLADVQEKKDQKATEYAKNINRSYSQVLKDARAEDESLKHESSLDRFKTSLIKNTIKKTFIFKSRP